MFRTSAGAKGINRGALFLLLGLAPIIRVLDLGSAFKNATEYVSLVRLAQTLPEDEVLSVGLQIFWTHSSRDLAAHKVGKLHLIATN